MAAGDLDKLAVLSETAQSYDRTVEAFGTEAAIPAALHAEGIVKGLRSFGVPINADTLTAVMLGASTESGVRGNAGDPHAYVTTGIGLVAKGILSGEITPDYVPGVDPAPDFSSAPPPSPPQGPNRAQRRGKGRR